MKLLLDTNTVIWLATRPERVSRAALDAMRSNACVVSVASYWEIAIKQALQKLGRDARFEEALADAGIGALQITTDHVWRVRDLPMIHKDPFDRLLVAQALAEGLAVVTSDAVFARYGVQVVSA